MPEDLGDGLYLALVGMGLVFFSLVAFMLILLALRNLFPSEEVAEVVETDEDPVAVVITDDDPVVAVIADDDPVAAAIREAEAEEEPAIAGWANAGWQEQTAAPDDPTNGRVSGAKVAAIAVALYLAMEQEGDVEHPTVLPSDWSTQGRAAHWASQGRRPQAYGQRSQSAYPPRNRLRE
jgi:Na+-transporting methylmalonyl-CoA/oxaloacetate decarboxylase gamma subunit